MEFLNLAQITVEASVWILLVSLIRSLFGKKCNANVRYFLWLFVALRVLLPVKLDLTVEIPGNWNRIPLSVAERVGPEAETVYEAEGAPGRKAGQTEGLDIAADDTDTPVPSGISSGSTSIAEQRTESFPVKTAFSLIWLCGVFCMTFYICLNNRRLHRILKAGRKKIRNLPGGLSLYAMPGYNCLAGILMPAVYVDIDGLKDPAVVKSVVCHELQHYRVRDHYWQLLRVLCLILQWHNPLMWWAYFASRRDCEAACDARVVRGMSKEERYGYGRSLLAVLECTSQRRRDIGFQTSMGAGRKFIAERIQGIIGPKRGKRAALSLGILLLAGVLCVLSFIAVHAENGRPEEKTEDEAEMLRKEGVGRKTDAGEKVMGAVTEAEAGSETAAEKDAGRNDDPTTGEVPAPTKEEVMAAREWVLEGMSREEIDRLKENVKVANQRMEQGYLNENLFQKLEDPESLYWNYFDQKGEIQIGWAYDSSYRDVLEGMEKENISKEEFYARYGTPVLDSNRFDAENFIELFSEMKESVKNEKLQEDLQLIMDETALAAETHEVEHAIYIYRLLHDMDYYLLRYGMEDVGKYVRDTSLISRYYGVLSVYE